MKYTQLAVALLAGTVLSACSHLPTKSDSSSVVVRKHAHADGTWADNYVNLLQSGKQTSHADFAKLKATLDDIRLQANATYAYIIMPIKDGKADINGDIHGDFMLTIDGSEEPEEWGETYDSEVQFIEAWQGSPSVARSAWDDDGATQWSTFAPIYDSQGKVIGLLGLDFPVDDVIATHPEWNRDDKRWNGYTDKITGEIPTAIKEKTSHIKALVAKHAKTLSGK